MTSPDPIQLARVRWPPEQLVLSVTACLEEVSPSASRLLATIPNMAFGIDSGFFYLPSAIGLEWGASDSDLEWLQTTVALGHIYYVIQDLVVDDGLSRRDWFIVAEAALTLYLARLADFDRRRMSSFLTMHLRQLEAFHGTLELEARRRSEVWAPTARDLVNLGNKALPGLTVVSIASFASDRKGDSLTPGVLSLCAALQIEDDLLDLEADWRSGLVSPPAALALTRVMGIKEGPFERGAIDVNRLLGAVMLSGVASGLLQFADRLYEMAGVVAAQYGSLTLSNIVARHRFRLSKKLAQL